MNKNELKKKISLINRPCYYFYDIIIFEDLVLMLFCWMKNHTKLFWFMTFYTKL